MLIGHRNAGGTWLSATAPTPSPAAAAAAGRSSGGSSAAPPQLALAHRPWRAVSCASTSRRWMSSLSALLGEPSGAYHSESACSSERSGAGHVKHACRAFEQQAQRLL